MNSMQEREGTKAKEDLLYEGRDKIFLDEDRIINEGLSGGSVHARHDTANIEEARELEKEQPPYKAE